MTSPDNLIDDGKDGVADRSAIIAALDEMAGMRSVPSVLTRAGREFIADKVLRLRATTSCGGVKKLEWELNRDFAADTPFGLYEVEPHGTEWHLLLGGGHLSSHSTEAEAKAAAQADFDQRIRSALEPAEDEPVATVGKFLQQKSAIYALNDAFYEDDLDGRVEIIEQSETLDGGTALTMRQYDQEVVTVVYFPPVLPPTSLASTVKLSINEGDVARRISFNLLSKHFNGKLTGDEISAIEDTILNALLSAIGGTDV